MVKESNTSSVDKKNIDDRNIVNMADLLRTVSGIDVIESGDQLNIRIRGVRSLMGSNDPLIMLNGNQFFGSLNILNVRDIKSIDVLKNASSIASYGSRGANGVILIKTK